MPVGPMTCLCCGEQASRTDVIGFRCDCHKHGPTGMASMCRDCGKCRKHCACPEGYTEDWNEVQRRAETGTLSNQRAALATQAREPGVYVGGVLAFPAADPDELEADLAAELAFERARDAVIRQCRSALLAYYSAERMAVHMAALRHYVEAYDTAKAAYARRYGAE